MKIMVCYNSSKYSLKGQENQEVANEKKLRKRRIVIHMRILILLRINRKKARPKS